MKVQYCGLSDSRVISATDTINGAVAGGAGIQLSFNLANSYIIDGTQAPYNTAAVGNVLTALVALPHGEFADVTSTPATQHRIAKYGTAPTGTSLTSHQVTSGAVPTFVVGAGATAFAATGSGANDDAGAFTVTALAAGNTADEILGTVTFAQTYPAPPKDVTIAGHNVAAENANLYATNITATSFQIAAHVAPAASAVMTGSYEVTG